MKHASLTLLCLASLALQGCILDLFLAPKIEAQQLPGEEALNEFKAAYTTHCSACHPLIHPKYFNRDKPIERYTQRYRKGKLLNARETQIVETYIRALAANP